MHTNRQVEKSQRRSRLGYSTAALMVSALLLPTWLCAREKDLSDPGRFLRMSRTIFRGRVVHSETFFDRDTGDILTRYLFQVDETLKGPESGQIEMIEYGGTVGELTMVVPHAAKYRPRAEYLVFTWRDNLGRARTLGGDQGALPLIPDDGGNAAVRLAPNHPLKSLLPNGNGLLVDFRTLSRVIAGEGENELQK